MKKSGYLVAEPGRNRNKYPVRPNKSQSSAYGGSGSSIPVCDTSDHFIPLQRISGTLETRAARAVPRCLGSAAYSKIVLDLTNTASDGSAVHIDCARRLVAGVFQLDNHLFIATCLHLFLTAGYLISSTALLLFACDKPADNRRELAIWRA